MTWEVQHSWFRDEVKAKDLVAFWYKPSGWTQLSGWQSWTPAMVGSHDSSPHWIRQRQQIWCHLEVNCGNTPEFCQPSRDKIGPDGNKECNGVNWFENHFLDLSAECDRCYTRKLFEPTLKWCLPRIDLRNVESTVARDLRWRNKDDVEKCYWRAHVLTKCMWQIRSAECRKVRSFRCPRVTHLIFFSKSHRMFLFCPGSFIHFALRQQTVPHAKCQTVCHMP